ncbi:MAG: peptidase, partial [Acidobacteria bacterium]|nr:peptidase [Acidobacteriota bacterium]
KPRRYDPRSGVQGIEFLDFASPFREPIRKQYSARFRLVKKDPSAPVSEAVEPIVYYVDHAVPEPIRSALVEGASWWDKAFEAIGFRNAMQVRVLPADADPMDLRYNMILWIHRPTRGWSSGSSVRDPRTGEIICGRVYLGSQRIRQDFMIGSGLKALYGGERANTAEVEEMALLRIRQLSAHEVGHTLGFNHNFAASTAGRASVMDYPHPYVRMREDGTLDFSDAYTRGIGEWDKVFVAFAYSHFPDGTDEDAALDRILSAAHSRGHFCLSDVGEGSASPYTHQWDHGSDPLAEMERVMQIRQAALAGFSEGNIPLGTPLARLEEVLVPVYLFHRYQTEAASKYIGGVDYRAAVRGDGQKTVEVVPATDQRRALGLVLGTITPDVLALPRSVLQLIPPRSGVRGGEVFPRRTAPTFDPLAAAETAANHTLSLLLNAARAARLLANRALDPNAPALDEVFEEILNRTWKASPPADPYLAEIHRAVNNVALYRLMGLAANAEASAQVRATASYKIDQIKSWLQPRTATGDEAHRAHFHFALAQIEQFQADPGKFVIPAAAAAPPGAPIGTVEEPWPGLPWDY